MVVLLGGIAIGHAIAGSRSPTVSPADAVADAQASFDQDCVSAWNNQSGVPKMVAGDFANAGPTSVSVGAAANAPGYCLITVIANAGLDMQFEQLPSGQWSEVGSGQFSTLDSSITTNINAYGDRYGDISLGTPPAPGN